MSQGYYARSDASSAGAALAAVREEMNLSVSDVARQLKLTPSQVEALEEGAYERLPGRVFVRGFLRNYAKLLGIDPQPLLRRIEHEMPRPRAEEEPPPALDAVMPTGERSRWPTYTWIIATVIVALAAYEFGFNNPPPEDGAKAAGTEASARTAKPAPSAALDSTRAAASSQAPAQAEAAPAVPASPASAPPPYTVASVAPAASGAAAGVPLNPALSAPGAGAEAVKARPGERQLHFRFEQESWVEIRDRNDRVIFSKLNRAGSEEYVAGVPPLKLVVGNARAVALSSDAKPVDLSPYIGVTVARLTVQ